MRRRLRIYLAVHRFLKRTEYAATASFTALFLTALRRGDLHDLDAYYYDHDKTYFDRQHNLGGLFPWERQAIECHFGAAKKLLVLAAGGGREVLALTKMGFEVHGFECHDGLLARGNELLVELGVRPPLRSMKRDVAPENANGRYDGALIGWGTYSNIRGTAERQRLLKQLREQLEPGAPLLLSFWYRVDYNRFMPWALRMANVARKPFHGEPIEEGDRLTPNFAHCFAASEVRAELEAGGFAAIEIEARTPAFAVGKAR